MIALIDGDSISFILGWHNRDHQSISTMHQAIDQFLEDMFLLTGADMYYGAIGTDHKCFRYDTYKVKPYKGKRPELQPFMEFWRPIVKTYLKEQWKFEEAFHSVRLNSKIPEIQQQDWVPSTAVLEADDLVGTVAYDCQKELQDFIVCSPDKDLRQISGSHYDYRTGETFQVSESQAHYNFFNLMLQGDTVDGVCGIPGFGPKKAEDKLKPLLQSQADRITYEELVKSLYHKHFGSYYGDIIYKETEQAISLVWDKERKIEIHSVPQRKEIHPFDSLSGAD